MFNFPEKQTFKFLVYLTYRKDTTFNYQNHLKSLTFWYVFENKKLI